MPVFSETYGTGVTYSYQNAAAVLASTTTYSDHTAGDMIGTEDEDFRYIVAATGATDHHIENAAGTPVKFYIQDKGGIFPFVALGLNDGVTNAFTKFEEMCQYCVTNDLTLDLGSGDIVMNTSQARVYLTRGERLKIINSNGARIVLDNDLEFGQGRYANAFKEVVLAEDAAAYDMSILVDDGTTLEAGDLIHIISDATAGNYPDNNRTGSGNQKQCVRRINAVDGNRLYLDQPLDFFFTTSDTTGNNTVNSPVSVEMEGVHFYGNADNVVRLRGCVDSHFKNCIFEGEYRQADGGAGNLSDTLTMNNCDRVTFDKCRFLKGYYNPSVSCCRGTVFRDCYSQGGRHMDLVGWSQDTLFENVHMVDTEVGFQSHPAIRCTFRNCTDAVSNVTDGHGYVFRGFGVTYENSHQSYYITPPTTNMPATSSLSVGAGYEYLGTNNPSYARDCKAPESGILASGGASLTVERCDFATILSSGTGAKMIVDDSSRARRREDPFNSMSVDSSGIDGAAFAMTDQQGKRMQVPTVSNADYSYRTANVTSPDIKTITGITQADPAVVTITSHGYTNGDVVFIGSVGGMTELNVKYFIVANGTANTFELTDLDGANIDSTAYTAYTSGGKCTLQAAVQTIYPFTKPACGLRTGLFTRSELFSGNTDSPLTYSYPVKFLPFSQGATTTKPFHGVLRAYLVTRLSSKIVQMHFAGQYDQTAYLSSVSNLHYSGAAEPGLTFTDTTWWKTGLNNSEGGSVSDMEGFRKYLTFDVDVTLPNASHDMRSVHLEIDFWQA